MAGDFAGRRGIFYSLESFLIHFRERAAREASINSASALERRGRVGGWRVKI